MPTKRWLSLLTMPGRSARVRSVRRRLARRAKVALLLLGVYGLIRRLRPNPNPAILRFHSVTGKEGRLYASPGITVPPHVFERQIRYLSRRYKIADMDQLHEGLASQRPLPPNTVVLTFDDGYEDNFAAALTLQRYGCTATFYVAADCLHGQPQLWMSDLRRRVIGTDQKRLRLAWNGRVFDYALEGAAARDDCVAALTSWVKTLNVARRDEFLRALAEALPITNADQTGDPVMLSWDQLRIMNEAGMLVGGHTLTHCNLARATEDELHREMTGCYDAITRQLGTPPRHFAYPNGGASIYYDERAKAGVRAAGFGTAATSCFGFVKPESDLLELPRIAVPASLAELVHSLEWGKLERIRRGEADRV